MLRNPLSLTAHTLSLSIVCGICHAEVNIPISIVSPIIGEGNRFPASAEEGEGHDENNNLRASVQTCTEDIVVLQKPLRLISSKIPLTPQSNCEEADDCRIYSRHQPSYQRVSAHRPKQQQKDIPMCQQIIDMLR